MKVKIYIQQEGTENYLETERFTCAQFTAQDGWYNFYNEENTFMCSYKMEAVSFLYIDGRIEEKNDDDLDF